MHIAEIRSFLCCELFLYVDPSQSTVYCNDQGNDKDGKPDNKRGKECSEVNIQGKARCEDKEEDKNGDAGFYRPAKIPQVLNRQSDTFLRISSIRSSFCSICVSFSFVAATAAAAASRSVFCPASIASRYFSIHAFTAMIAI